MEPIEIAMDSRRTGAALPPQDSAPSEAEQTVASMAQRGYDAGFFSDIASDVVPPGLDADVVRLISAKKGEPGWLLDWRLQAFERWQHMTPPRWAHVDFPDIDFQAISYYAAPRLKASKRLEDLNPEERAAYDELMRTYDRLGVPLRERGKLAADQIGVDAAPLVAVDAVFDSVSVVTTFREQLASVGVIFCSFSEAVREHPELVRRWLGTVVPPTDNFYAALNAAVFSDGSFCYIPKGVRCPMELSTYFRINAKGTGQFERTLLIADEGASVSYLEGCTAPQRDENQLHAAVVELVALDGAEIKYSTVQNWYPGDANGVGGVYNFVTKRGICKGRASRIRWTQVETGSAITWKYPSCILEGDDSVGEFYSVALSNHRQQADTGTKMIHLGRNTRSTILSKGIAAGHGRQTYRGQVKIAKSAVGARNYTACDSLLIGDKCRADTVPYIEVAHDQGSVEHEASTSRISEEQLYYLQARGLSQEDAVQLIVNGFCKDVFRVLPMEFAVEAQKLLELSLEGAVG